MGEGYGLGIGILVDPTVSEMAGTKGSYNWAGAYSTYFWVDPQEDLVGLIMAQFQPIFYYPIHREFRKLVYLSQ